MEERIREQPVVVPDEREAVGRDERRDDGGCKERERTRQPAPDEQERAKRDEAGAEHDAPVKVRPDEEQRHDEKDAPGVLPCVEGE